MKRRGESGQNHYALDATSGRPSWCFVFLFLFLPGRENQRNDGGGGDILKEGDF